MKCWKWGGGGRGRPSNGQCRRLCSRDTGMQITLECFGGPNPRERWEEDECGNVVGVAGALLRSAERNSRNDPRGCWLDDPMRVDGESQSLPEDALGAGDACGRLRGGARVRLSPRCSQLRPWTGAESESESEGERECWRRQRGDGAHSARAMAGEAWKWPYCWRANSVAITGRGVGPSSLSIRAFGDEPVGRVTGGPFGGRSVAVGWSMLSLNGC
jgi:hypothetical protein